MTTDAVNLGCGDGYVGIFPVCFPTSHSCDDRGRRCNGSNVEAWNVRDCRWDSEPCDTGYCENGFCKPKPPTAQEPNQYLASQWEVWFGCKEGYTRPQFGDYCVKQVSPATAGATDWAKYVPYVVIGFVLFMLFGGKR